ncbi:MAG: hypothetical protein SCK70_17005, partial [bacterium]|nr:hypothetical protein [bacterium]
MANKTALGWAILLCLVCLLPLGLMGQDNAQQYRRPGTNTEYELIDWTTYSMTRWVTSLAVGREFVYFGTTGGITRYNLYSNQWDRPHTVSDGLPDNFIISVAYDFNTDYIWCSTPQGVSVYRSIWQRWENVFKDELRISNSDEIVSIGFDREQVWLESRAGLFFKSENQTTQFESVAAGAIPNASISWFGNRAFLGAQMPELVMHGGYFFDSRGIIKDTNLDDYPVTCIGRDPWNTIWVGSWGLGVGKADARIKILEMIPDGLFISEVSAFEIDG